MLYLTRSNTDPLITARTKGTLNFVSNLKNFYTDLYPLEYTWPPTTFSPFKLLEIQQDCHN